MQVRISAMSAAVAFSAANLVISGSIRMRVCITSAGLVRLVAVDRSARLSAGRAPMKVPLPTWRQS